LVERHETLRIPTALALLGTPAPAAGGPFLAVGDGIYNTADNRWTAPHSSYLHFFSSVFGSRSARASMELPRLVSSTYELKNCASAWRAEGDTVFLTGPGLSRAKIVPALLLKPAIIHIAAHVLYPNGKPDEALIHLGLGAKGLAEVLTTKDVSALHADGALVVLSGCSSGAGNSVRGAGVMGLTRAWLLAGARAVVGSRWPVPDDSGDLFRSFYAHLAASKNGRSGLSYALQQAELDMLRSGQWRSDPRYWGAFYLLAKE
jgi:CHAT domain-containing protein